MQPLPIPAGARVVSMCADDPDFQEILAEFLECIATRPAELRALFEAGDLEALRVQAHQLKGAGGGYGYPGLTAAAAELEAACKLQILAGLDAALDRLTDYLFRMTS